MTVSAATRAEAGAQWLDTQHPGGWAGKITNPIDMRSGHNCVGGQLYDGYHNLHRVLNDLPGQLLCVALGFMPDGWHDGYRLTAAWYREVARRQGVTVAVLRATLLLPYWWKEAGRCAGAISRACNPANDFTWSDTTRDQVIADLEREVAGYLRLITAANRILGKDTACS